MTYGRLYKLELKKKATSQRWCTHEWQKKKNFLGFSCILVCI
jgi:hypothetical protein